MGTPDSGGFSGSLEILVETPPEFQFRSTVLSHGWYQLAPYEFSEGVLSRPQLLSDGAKVVLRFEEGSEGSIALTAVGLDKGQQQRYGAELRQLARRIFQLDLDLTTLYERLEGDSRYRWVQANGAGRFLRSPTVWEDLVKILLTTNIHWTGTVSMVRRLTELGPAVNGRDAAFPSPEAIASMSPTKLSEEVGAGYRTSYLRSLARKVASGELEVEGWAGTGWDSTELFEAVKELDGFGPYAAGAMLALLGHYDRLPLDSEARAMFAREFGGGEEAKDGDIRAHYSAYEPWQGLVLWLDVMGPASDG